MSKPISACWLYCGLVAGLAMFGLALAPLDFSPLSTQAAAPPVPPAGPYLGRGEEPDFDELIALISAEIAAGDQADPDNSPAPTASLSLKLGSGQTIEEPTLWQRWWDWAQACFPW